MRAQFNKIGSTYHVNLVNDKTLPTQTLNVLSAKGIAYQRPVGAWRAANGYGATVTITGVQISGTTVPIFLTDNVLLYQGQNNYTNCCILGYHGAGMPIGHGAGSAKRQRQAAGADVHLRGLDDTRDFLRVPAGLHEPGSSEPTSHGAEPDSRSR
jgi:hypothetical protein